MVTVLWQWQIAQPLKVGWGKQISKRMIGMSQMKQLWGEMYQKPCKAFHGVTCERVLTMIPWSLEQYLWCSLPWPWPRWWRTNSCPKLLCPFIGSRKLQNLSSVQTNVFWLILLLQSLPVKTQLQENMRRTNLVWCRLNRLNGLDQLDLLMKCFLTDQTITNESSTLEPLPWLSMMGDFWDCLMTPWLRA